MAKKSSSTARTAGDSPRVTRSAKQARTQDVDCTVRVYFTGHDAKTGKPLGDNITGTLYIKDTSVSEAMKQVEAAFA